MSGDQREVRADDDAALRALFRARRERAAAQTPSFEALLSRPHGNARARRGGAAWRLAAAAAAIAGAVLLVRGVPRHAPRAADVAVALPAIRLPSDALLAATPLPSAAGDWSSLPSAVLGRAPVDLASSRTR